MATTTMMVMMMYEQRNNIFTPGKCADFIDKAKKKWLSDSIPKNLSITQFVQRPK